MWPIKTLWPKRPGTLLSHLSILTHLTHMTHLNSTDLTNPSHPSSDQMTYLNPPTSYPYLTHILSHLLLIFPISYQYCSHLVHISYSYTTHILQIIHKYLTHTKSLFCPYLNHILPTSYLYILPISHYMLSIFQQKAFQSQSSADLIWSSNIFFYELHWLAILLID